MADWNRTDIEELIDMFQNENNLWDTTNQNYFKKEYRLRSLEKIRESFENKYTVDEINSKIKYLRCYYARELSKFRKSQKSGAGTEDLFKSKWQYFPSLDVFLRGQITPRQSTSNLDSQSEDMEDNLDLDMSCEDKPLQKSVYNPRRKRLKPADCMTETVSIQQPNVDDADAFFAKYLETEMKKINDPIKRNGLKVKLLTLVLDAQKEQL